MLLKILKVAEKLPSRIWIGLKLGPQAYKLQVMCGLKTLSLLKRKNYQSEVVKGYHDLEK